jgi:hypothetical protein
MSSTPRRSARPTSSLPKAGQTQKSSEPRSAWFGSASRFEVAAAGMASYDPAFDADRRVLRAAIASASALTNPTSPLASNGLER